MNRSTVAVSLCALLLAVPAVPQQKSTKSTKSTKGQPTPAATADQAAQTQPKPPSFTSTTTEIILPITVVDDKGRYVSNLQESDFRIYDEGRLQKSTYFYHDSVSKRQNTVIGFLVDQSNGSKIHWDKFKDATKEMIWGLLPNDPNYSGYLISYNQEAKIRVDTTTDPDKLTDEVDRMLPGGGSALFNAIYKACTDRKLVPGEPYQPRRVIIVIGDGHDTASQYTLDQVIELAIRNQVTVFGVSTLAFGSSSDDSDNLEQIALRTGGKVQYPLANPYSEVSGYLSQPSDYGNYALTVGSGGYASAIASAVNKSVEALQGEITTQYILHYIPDIDPRTAYKDKRNIEVRIGTLPPGSVKVRTRQYYFANPVRPSGSAGQ